MKQKLRSLTARGMNGYKLYSRNWPNSRALADEFCLSKRGKKSTAPGCISSRRLRSAFGIVLKTRQSLPSENSAATQDDQGWGDIRSFARFEALRRARPRGRRRPHPRHWEALGNAGSIGRSFGGTRRTIKAHLRSRPTFSFKTPPTLARLTGMSDFPGDPLSGSVSHWCR